MQIRGFQLRMPLDIQFVFTANPEDYTNRGSIVTPLKDRIGSQIFTHYPSSIEIAKRITEQESFIAKEDKDRISMCEAAKDLLEQVAFEARSSEYVDEKSGVSARLTISAMENLLAAAKLRLIENGEEKTSVRLVDFDSIIPSITGKIELVYEGEQEGAAEVARLLIDGAVTSQFELHFPKIPNLEKEGVKTTYTDVIEWFNNHDLLELNYTDTEVEYNEALNAIKPLTALVEKYCGDAYEDDKRFYKELVLWSLSSANKLDRTESEDAFRFDASGAGKFFFGDN